MYIYVLVLILSVFPFKQDVIIIQFCQVMEEVGRHQWFHGVPCVGHTQKIRYHFNTWLMFPQKGNNHPFCIVFLECLKHIKIKPIDYNHSKKHRESHSKIFMIQIIMIMT